MSVDSVCVIKTINRLGKKQHQAVDEEQATVNKMAKVQETQSESRYHYVILRAWIMFSDNIFLNVYCKHFLIHSKSYNICARKMQYG